MTLLERYGLPPSQIEEVGLRRADSALPADASWSPAERAVVRRIVWAAGDPSLASAIRIHPSAIAEGIAALRRGCTICADVRMVAVAIDSGRAAELAYSVCCLIDEPSVIAESRRTDLPRAAIAMRSLAGRAGGEIAVVGTAPTALLALLDTIDAGGAPPALIVGTPVGFVGAAEAKAELVARDVPFITIDGTRGGAALAATTVNAIIRLAAAPSSPDAER